MKMNISAVPSFGAALSSVVNERIARAQAIVSLSTFCDPGTVPAHTIAAANAAALDIVQEVIANLTSNAGDFIGRDSISAVNSRLSKAEAVMKMLVHCRIDLLDGETRDLASDSAIAFLQEAMEVLEAEAE